MSTNGTWVDGGLALTDGKNLTVVISQIERVLAFSTTTPLGANAVYTSPTIDAINYKLFTLSVTSDVAGNFVRQHSDDGATWISETSTALGAGTISVSSVSVYRRYFRVVYTNGTGAQTSFSASAYLSPL